MLEQEPQLDPGKTVRQVVEEAVRPILDLLKEFEQVSARFAEPHADFDLLIEKAGAAAGNAGQSTTPGTWTAAWRWRWMPCAAHPAMRRWR
jgi:ATPase subunit of ABC transporter with duplicated ATPase domains